MFNLDKNKRKRQLLKLYNYAKQILQSTTS